MNQDSQPRPPPSLDSKGNTKFEILIIKMFTLKQKTNQIHPATIKKINFVSSRKHVQVDQGLITMEKCKTKTIQTDLGILTLIPTYSVMIRWPWTCQAYSGIIRAYKQPCVTLACSEP